MRRLVLLAALTSCSAFLCGVVPGTGVAASTTLIGNSSVESNQDSNAPGLAEAFPFRAVASGRTDSVSVYVDAASTATGLTVGVYADGSGHPRTLLASGKGSSAAGEWNRITLSSSPTISSGSTYWLALLGTGGVLNFRDQDRGNGACSENSAVVGLTALSSPWTSGASWASCTVSAYVTGGVNNPLPAPVNTASPAIGGQAVQGGKLTASTGSWSNSPISYAYQWEDCNSAGASCTAISGATGSSYVLVSADVGKTVRVVVTATNSPGSASAASAASAVVSAPTPPPTAVCTTTLSSGSLGSSPYPGAALEAALRSAAGGSTICLSAGVSGPIDLYGVSPSGNVTVQPAPGASVALGALSFGANTHNLTFTGFSAIGGVAIGSSGASCCSNLLFTFDAFTGGSYVRDVTNSGIVFAHDTFNNIDVCSGCYEGRIEVVSSAVSQPDGVTIENSVMDGGNSDGVQDDGIGTQIRGNEFANIVESSCGVIHCDAIQTVGATGTVIDGNYLHGTTDCFLMDDGGSNISITNNVCGPMAGDSSFWIQAGGIRGLTLSHNTIIARTGGAFGNGPDGSPSSDVSVMNNIEYSAPSVNPGQSLSGTTSEGYNLVQSCGGSLCGGSRDIVGAPKFVGGQSPSTWAGFALAAGSLGIGNASDGKNRGVSVFSVTPGP